jgi:hypothetical protein
MEPVYLSDLSGKRVAVSGKFEILQKDLVKALKIAGVTVAKITKNIDFVVVGNNLGSVASQKITELKLRTITWDTLEVDVDAHLATREPIPYLDHQILKDNSATISQALLATQRVEIEKCKRIWSFKRPKGSTPSGAKWDTTDVYLLKENGKMYAQPRARRPLRSKIRHMYQTISSQLLFYRLVVLFGMPPPSTRADIYKTCWAIDIFLADRSQLVFHDFKGCAELFFTGSYEGGISALNLIDLVLDLNFPHVYENVVAGRHA